MHTDIFLEIGGEHKVCEDYIIQGTTPVPYIILSDGCSTANGSEMGARILCHLAKQFLKYNKDDIHDLDYWKLGTWVIHNAEQTARQLGLSTSCLTATLIVAYYVDNRIRIMIYGDGSFINIDPLGNLEITTVDYSSNAPYYLVYLVDSFRHGLYDEAKHTKKVTHRFVDESETTDEYAYDHPLDYFLSTAVTPTVLIASDGVDSFLRKSGTVTQHLKSHEVLPECVAFKNIKGEFLKRRLNRQMKTFEKSGISHYDDLSMGAFIKEVK